MYFFFFQAEDGIRDVAVTGVQTCALPIESSSPGFFLHARDPRASQIPNLPRAPSGSRLRKAAASRLEAELPLSAGAELGTLAMFENGNDFVLEMIDLRVGQRGFAALESDSNQQGILPGRNIFTAEQVDGLNRSNLLDVKRSNRLRNLCEGNPLGEQQGKIALHGRKTGEWHVALRGFCRLHCRIKRG